LCVLLLLLGCGQPWSCLPHLCVQVLLLVPLTPMPSSHSSPCHTSSLSCVPMPVHNSCAPEVSPHLNCETVAILLCPANRPFVGCLLCLSAQPVPLLLAGLDGCPAAQLSPRQMFSGIPPQEQPVLGLRLLRLVLVLLGRGDQGGA
jgi:hypothetical protein